MKIDRYFFLILSVKPSPQGIETDRPNEKVESAHGSVRRNEDESIRLKCIIDPADVTSRNGPQWQFSKDDKSFTDLPAGVNVENGEIVIGQVKKAQRGYYRCALNDVEFTVLLRVKGLFNLFSPKTIFVFFCS
jgi:hypothetical protein